MFNTKHVNQNLQKLNNLIVQKLKKLDRWCNECYKINIYVDILLRENYENKDVNFRIYINYLDPFSYKIKSDKIDDFLFIENFKTKTIKKELKVLRDYFVEPVCAHNYAY